MEKLSREDIKSLLGGWIAGSGCSIPLLFTGTHELSVLVVKFVGLIAAGFITGLCTVLGNDFYKYKVKHKLFKNNKKVDDDARDKEKVA